MESYQRNHVIKVLPKLLNLMKCNAELMAELQSSKSLSNIEANDLLESLSPPSEKVKKLVKLLLNKDNGYFNLLSALEKTNQTGDYSEIVVDNLLRKPSLSEQLITTSKYKHSKQDIDSLSSMIKDKHKIVVMCTTDCDITTDKIIDLSKINNPPIILEMLNESLLPLKVDPGFYILNGLGETTIDTLNQFVKHVTGVLIAVIKMDKKSSQKLFSTFKHLRNAKFYEHKINWFYFQPSFQSELMQRNFKWQSTQSTLKDTVTLCDSNDNVENLINGSFLVGLVNDNYPELISDKFATEYNCYVSRKLVCQNILSKSILNDEKPDIIMVININRSQLSSLVTHDFTDMANTQIRQEEILCRHLVMESEDEFVKVCHLAKNNTSVHWLSYNSVNGKLTWIKSVGSVALIRKHAKNSENIFNEEELISVINNDNYHQVICISGSPGMGKSILLYSLGRKLQLQHYHTMLSLNLSELLQCLPDFHGKVITAEASLGTLIKASEKNELAQAVLISRIKARNIKVTILIDGIDEIRSDERSTVTEALKIAVHTYSIKIVIATRPHLCTEIEEAFNVISYFVLPFNEQDQLKFLCDVWYKPDLSYEALTNYAKMCNTNLEKNLKSEASNFKGLPLMFLIISEICKDSAIKYSKGGCVTANDNINLQFTIPNLFKEMIARQLNIFKQKNPDNGLNNTNLMMIFVIEALQSIYPTYLSKHPKLLKTLNSESKFISITKCFNGMVKKYITKQNGFKQPKDIIYRIGFIESDKQTQSPVFIHRMFAEYFIAWFYMEFLRQPHEYREWNDFFYEEVFRVRDVKERIFREQSLSSCDDPIVIATFCEPVIAVFVNNFFQPLKPYKVQLPANVNCSRFFEACLHGDLLHMCRAFMRSYVNERDLLLAVKFSKVYILSTLADEYVRAENAKPLVDILYHCAYDKKYHTLLDIAVERGDFSIVEFLLKEGGFSSLVKEKKSRLHYLINTCVEWSNNESKQNVDERREILKKLVSDNRHILCSRDRDHRGALLRHAVHIRLLLDLIDLDINLNSCDKDGCSVIHYASSYLSAIEFEELVEHIYKKDYSCLKRLINIKCANGNTPLHYLLRHIDPNSSTLKLFSKLQENLNADNNDGDTVLHVAIESKRSINCLSMLIELGVDYRLTNRNAETPLHIAARCKYTLGLEFLLKQNLDVNACRRTGETALLSCTVRSPVKLEDLNLLICSGADTKVVTVNQISILHYAAKYGCENVVLEILSCGLNANARTDMGDTPLHYAMENKSENQRKIVSALLQFKADPELVNEDNLNPLLSALKRTPLNIHIGTLKLLLRNSNTITVNTALSKLLEISDLFKVEDNLSDIGASTKRMSFKQKSTPAVAVLKFILSNQRFLKLNGQSKPKNLLLQSALLSKCQFEAVQFLLEQSPDINISNEEIHLALETSITKGVASLELRTLVILEQKEIKLKEKLATQALYNLLSMRLYKLEKGVREKYVQLIKFFLDRGADLAHSFHKSTMLNMVVKAGNVEAVKILLEGGSNVDATDNDKNTPLHLALELFDWENQYEIVNILLLNNANINCMNQNERTPISNTLCSDNKYDLATIELLCTKNYIHSSDSATALLRHLVRVKWRGQELRMVRLAQNLINMGANVFHKDEDGSGLANIAERSGCDTESQFFKDMAKW